MNYKIQLYWTGLLFTLHNVEEFIGFIYFNPDTLHLDGLFNKGEMLFSIVAITFLAWIVILWGSCRTNQTKRDILTVFTLVFLINAFFPHIIASIAFQMYFPALITSVLLYLPYSFVILPKLYKSYPLKSYFYRVAVIGLFIVLLALIGIRGLGNIEGLSKIF